MALLGSRVSNWPKGSPLKLVVLYEEIGDGLFQHRTECYDGLHRFARGEADRNGDQTIIALCAFALTLVGFKDGYQLTEHDSPSRHDEIVDDQDIDSVTILPEGRRYESEVEWKDHTERQRLVEAKSSNLFVVLQFVRRTFWCVHDNIHK